MTDDPVEKFRIDYTALSTEYELPELTELNSEYTLFDNLRDVGHPIDFPLRYCKQVIVNAMDYWISFLHGAIMPGQGNMVQYEEANALTEEDKEYAFEIIKKFMGLGRRKIRLSLYNRPEEDAAFIRDAHSTFQESKQELETIALKIEGTWNA